MWIALAIIAFLAVLITVILLLPVDVIIKNDENNELILRYKLLGKVYGENPNPNDPIVKALNNASGIHRLDTKQLKENAQTKPLKEAVSDSLDLIWDLLKELASLLKYGTAKKFHIHIHCTGDDPADNAFLCGKYYAISYGLLHMLRPIIRIPKRACQIQIDSGDLTEKEIFRYDVLLRVHLRYVLAAFWRLAYTEAQRVGAQERALQEQRNRYNSKKRKKKNQAK